MLYLYTFYILMTRKISDTELSLLLSHFNDRDNSAFCEVYEIIYGELFYFTSSVYRDTEIVASDVLHDIFIKLWESKSVKFNTLLSIKGYMYISVKNKFRDYISHRKTKDKFTSTLRVTDDYFVSQIAESETLSIVNEAVEALPAECAKVFRMFIDGWEVKDIAKSLNKSQSTVYAQKQEAINILRRKFPKDKMLLIMLLLNP